MAFIDIYSEIKGAVPKLPVSLARSLAKRAYADVLRKNLWSFQVYDKNWISPAVVNTGLSTTVQGSTTVMLDATATAAVNASITAYNPINQRQFRLGISTICNIIGWDQAGNLTIDRGFPDPGGTGLAYQIYQVYYPAPYQDHISFVSVRDMVNFTDLILDKNRSWLDEQDPQRTYYYFPTHVVPFMQGQDSTNTATYQTPMFELWGVPLSNRAYQLYGIRQGVPLVNNSDIVVPPITDEVVIERGKYFAYEWAEAHKGELPRNQGPDFRFLMGQVSARYEEMFKELRRRDRETIDNWFRVRRRSLYGKYYAQYNTISGTAYPGAYMG